MPKCVYCGKVYEPPYGLTLVGKEGHVKYLCSGKCRKNMAMKRKKVRWISKKEKTEKSKKEAKEDLKEKIAESNK